MNKKIVAVSLIVLVLVMIPISYAALSTGEKQSLESMRSKLTQIRSEIDSLIEEIDNLLDTTEEPPTETPTEQQTPEPTANYVVLKCEFHMHTTFSDGKYSPADMIQYYSDHGYDVVAVTDHTNVLNWHGGLVEAKAAGQLTGITVIEGGEISFRWDDGTKEHIVALFCHAMDSTNAATTLTMKQIFDDIHAKGGIGIVAHPWSSWNNWQNYIDASYIDGWEYEPYAISAEYRSWLLSSNKIYVFDHDAHGYWLDGGNWGEAHTLLMAHNNTEAGVREALEACRAVVSYQNRIYGSTQAINLYNTLMAGSS
jgi:hypothetical protein